MNRDLAVPLVLLAFGGLMYLLALYSRFSYDRSKSRKVIAGDLIGGKRMGSINIAGRSFSGNSITMTGGRIIIDGVDITDQSGIEDPKTILTIKVEGDPISVKSDLSVSVMGNVAGNVGAGGSVNCNDVGGDVNANGSVNADDITGNVDAGGSVNCDDVGGSVNAGGSVRHG